MVTRKNVRILILLACGIALVLASSGCKKKEDVSEPNDVDVVGPKDPCVGGTLSQDPPPPGDPPPPPPPPPAKVYLVEPLVGIDKVAFGMTVDQMKEVLGEPKRIRTPWQEYLDDGFSIFAMNAGVEMIVCGHRLDPNAGRVKNCKVRTKKGIGMGSASDDIIEAYGAPGSTERTTSGAIKLTYGSLKSEFLLMNDKVFYMSFTAKGSLMEMGR
jgi:hypothetical protein